MRIISGSLGGRRISIGKLTGIRPTTDRVRESIFNILHHTIEFHGTRVLDICAGSGILGFEALSRGATHCTFIEKNRKTATQLKKNAEALRVSEKIQVLTTDYHHGLSQLAEQINLHETPLFNCIFCDPPYHLRCLSEILQLIDTHNLLAENGIFIGEHAPFESVVLPRSMELIQQKNYGDSVVEILQQQEP